MSSIQTRKLIAQRRSSPKKSSPIEEGRKKSNDPFAVVNALIAKKPKKFFDF